MRVRKLVKRFLLYCEERRRPNTTRSYRSRLTPLVAQFGSRKLDSLTIEDVEQFLRRVGRWGDGTSKAPDTQRANIVAIQKLFGFAVDRGYITQPPFKALEKPQGRRRERIPTEKEDRAVEQQASPAFRLALLALRQSGARPGEIAAATIEDYDRTRRLIILKNHKTAHTGRVRKIGVGDKMAAIVDQAIGDRSSGPIFLDDRGQPWTAGKLSKHYKRACRRAGLPEDLCLYLARHKHATELCAKAGIHAASMSLGHADIKTTMRYVHADDRDLARNQDLI